MIPDGQGAHAGCTLRGMSETSQAPTRRPLLRSATDRRLGGVCGGVAAHLGIDPVILRVLVVVSAFFGAGLVVTAYLVLWLVLPSEDGSARGPMMSMAAVVAVCLLIFGATSGVALLALGSAELLFLLLVLIVLTVVIGWQVLHRAPKTHAFQPPAPVSAPVVDDVGGAADATEPPEPQPPAWWHARQARRPRRSPSLLARLTTGVALLALGAAVLIGAPARSAVAVALVTTAAGLVVGSVLDRGRPLIPLALVLAMALSVTHFATVPEATATTGTYLRPALVTDVTSYDAVAAAVTLDLSDVEAPASLGYYETLINVGSGHVVVIVPRTMDFGFRATLGAGTLVTFGSVDRGIYRDESGRTGGSTLAQLWVRIQVGVGTVEIRHAAS